MKKLAGYFIIWAIAAALAELVRAQPSSAIEIPLTVASAHDAVTQGSQVNGLSRDTQASFSEWSLEPIAPAPVGVMANIFTPYSLLFWYAADQHARYQPIDPSLAREALTQHQFSVNAIVLSNHLADNDGARIVIEQSGKIVQPTTNAVHQASPTRYFWQHVEASFDARQIDMATTFTVIVANLNLPGEGMAHEVRFAVDPSKIR